MATFVRNFLLQNLLKVARSGHTVCQNILGVNQFNWETSDKMEFEFSLLMFDTFPS